MKRTALAHAVAISHRPSPRRSTSWRLAGLNSWEEAPAPAHVGKRLIEGLFQIELPPQRARLVNNVTHWAFGIANGAAYGLVAGSLPTSRVSYGLPFGAVVWANGYVVLPAAKLYEPTGSTTSRRWATT